MPTAQGHNKKPWNKGKKMSKTDLQHLFVPREELTLFLAVALFFAGPKYVMVLWVTMVTSRRISEALQLQGCDVFLDGGFTHDAPHILFQKREENKDYKGLGKLGADKVVARLAPDVLSTLRDVIAKGVERCVLPPLEPFQQSHPNIFEDVQPLTTKPFHWPANGSYLFPAETKKAQQPWMARQSVSLAVSRIRKVMFALTGRRRWNQEFIGSHVTVHGATRHTSSALLLSNPKGTKRPSEHVIMEIQQRHDVGTFRRHYCHAHEEDVVEALQFAAVPVSFSLPAAPPAPENKGEKEEALSAVPCSRSIAASPAPMATVPGMLSAPGNAEESRKAWKATYAVSPHAENPGSNPTK
ncbi:unnamed protein product [Effrenium voratum]|nr:unnamed protein product [Effrenium voratum]